MSERELFRRYPETRSIPHVELGQFPTPVGELSETARALGQPGGHPSLWVKRDEQTGEEYGGNKVRKLEFLLGDALDQGSSGVWTVGAIGSHHVLATCIYAREVGLECAALHFPQQVTDHVLRNLKALSTTQPELKLVGEGPAAYVEALKASIRNWLRTRTETYYIPAGGSSAVGALGYVNAALEFARQVEDGELPLPDYIYVAAGTCGTLAGLLLGFKLAELPVKVIGVRVVPAFIANSGIVTRLANGAADLLEEAGVRDVPRLRRRDVELRSEYLGKDYGIPTAGGLHAIELLQQTEDLLLEPTYTGKTFAAIIAERKRLAEENATVLYWHTLSGADLSERVAASNPELDLPAQYQRFFEESGVGEQS